MGRAVQSRNLGGLSRAVTARSFRWTGPGPYGQKFCCPARRFTTLSMKLKPRPTIFSSIFEQISNCISTKLELSTRFLAIESQHSENKLLSVLNEQYYQHIYHTLAIEGNTLTPQEVR